MSRLLKQVVYGLFYLIILAGLVFGAYSLFFKPAPSCTDGKQNQGEQGIDCGGLCARTCTRADIGPIEISGEPQIFHPTASGISVLAKIQNPNSDYGAGRFSYTFKFYDSQDNLIQEVPGESFAYASEIKYLAEFNLSFSGFEQARRAELIIENPEWISSDSFKLPRAALQSAQTSKSDRGTLQVEGRFINNDSVTLPNVVVIALFYSQYGQTAGVSKNEIDNVPPGDSRTFSVIHPAISNIDVSRTAVFLYAKR
ncbi:MAG: hypothetical protein HY433_02150 [Candidatus Liptonbacteria bacterium]|nr:hypothetical protein [Candidatus Liptonbacteria bacterium]